MREWYKDNQLAILFDIRPCVHIRYALPSMSQKEKESIRKYPFINCHDLQVELYDYEKVKQYCFTIPKNYCWDGMTIPRVAWTLIGVSKENNCGMVASLLHDYLTENKSLIDNDRAFSTNIFNALLYTGGLNKAQRFIMKNCVACYQTLFCRW